MKRKSDPIVGLVKDYKSPKNKGNLQSEVWSDLRQSEVFSDCVLVSSDGVKYKSHRVLLATASPYFKAALVRSETNQLYIPFPSRTVEAIMDFVYTGGTQIGADNVEELLIAADHLCLSAVVANCCSFIESQITPRNAWRIYKFAAFYSCQSLASEAMGVILANFEDFFMEREEFLEMTSEELKCLVLKDELNVKREKLVIEAIDIWLQANIETRKVWASSLLEAVRWGFVTNEYIKSWLESVNYRDSICPKLLEDLNNYTPYSPNLPYTTVAKTLAFKPRIPHALLFASGGWSSHITDRLWTYDVRADRWLRIEGIKPKIQMAYHGMVCVNKIIYLVGGFDGRTYLNSTLSYDPVTLKWNRKSNMHCPRCYVSVVALHNEIYAIGGSSGHNRLRSVEKYNIATNQWKCIASMHYRRSDAGALSHGNKIFVFGGCDGESVLSSVEVYDAVAGHWMILADMSGPRRGLSVCLYEDWIYALGGSDGWDVLASCEKMCPQTYIWSTNVPPLATARSNFAAVVLEDSILVIGGFDGRKTMRKTEWFDGQEWTKGTSLRERCSALAVCLVAGISNAYQYSFSSRVSSYLENVAFHNE